MELLSNENFWMYNFSIARGDTKLLAVEKYEREEKRENERERERARTLVI